LKKPTVMIIKSSPWRKFQIFSEHPEYAAIFNVIERYKSKIDFVLVGSSSTSTTSFYLRDDIIAWDIKRIGLIGHFTYFFDFIRILFKHRTNLVIVLGLDQIPPVAIFSLFSRRKYVPIFIGEFKYHGRRNVGQILHRLFIKLFGLSLQISSKKILKAYALSQFVRDGVEKVAPNIKGRSSIVAYPLSPIFSCLQNTANSEEPILLTVSGIEQRKGLDTLIHSASQIEGKFKIMIKGEIRDPVYMRKLLNMVKALGLQDKITFNTQVENYSALVSYYNSAYSFVFPTREDCLGVVVLEALHCGVPVIATSVGGVPEMIQNGVNGILVKPNDPIELANAISFMLKNNDVREKMAKNTRHELSRYYKGKISLEEAIDQSITKLLD